MSTHISVIPKKDSEGRERTYLRLSQPNVPPFDRELSTCDGFSGTIKKRERI